MKRKSASVWIVRGSPVHQGSRAAHRSGMYLLPMTATTGDAMNKFIEESGMSDGKSYDSADIQSVEYGGWVWVDAEIG